MVVSSRSVAGPQSLVVRSAHCGEVWFLRAGKSWKSCRMCAGDGPCCQACVLWEGKRDSATGCVLESGVEACPFWPGLGSVGWEEGQSCRVCAGVWSDRGQVWVLWAGKRDSPAGCVLGSGQTVARSGFCGLGRGTVLQGVCWGLVRPWPGLGSVGWEEGQSSRVCAGVWSDRASTQCSVTKIQSSPMGTQTTVPAVQT